MLIPAPEILIFVSIAPSILIYCLHFVGSSV